MRNITIQSMGLRLAGAAVALLMTTSVAMAQGENPLGDRPAATAPPSASPAPRPAAAAATPAPTAKPAGIKDSGLVFQFKLGGNFTAGTGGGSPVNGGWLNGGFMFGYKLGRLVLGLGLEVGYSDYKAQAGGMDIEQSSSVVMFIPTIEYYLLVASPMVMYLSAGIHGGFLNVHQEPGEDYTDGAVGFHVGVGMRYFLAPRFAIGVEGGFRGIWLFFENDDDTDDDDETYGTMSFYGALVFTAIW